MNVYTCSAAGKKFAPLLVETKESGKVLIRRRGGSVFSLTPKPLAQSPPDVAGVGTEIAPERIVALVGEGREQG